MSFKVESPDGKTVEVDFAAFWRGRSLGEESGTASRRMQGRTENSKIRILKECDTFLKAFRNPVLVFSTLRESLEDGERKKIARLASSVPVMVLTARELCPYSGADDPKGSQDNRSLDYGSSLADICRITQISYVGLGDGNHPDK